MTTSLHRRSSWISSMAYKSTPDGKGWLVFYLKPYKKINGIKEEEKEGTLLYELEQIGDSLTQLFTKNNLQKVKMPDGTSLTKSSNSRSVIVAEKLLEHPALVRHINVKVIEECTDKSDSKPFVRVTYPKATATKGEEKK